MFIPFADLVAEYQSIKAEIHEAIEGVLEQGSFILGPQLEVFERAFANFSGAQYGIGVSNGLDALRLTLTALDIGPGDTVLLPANTYIATALAVSAVGATPQFVDCDPGTYNMTALAVEQAITARARAIIIVHFAGQAAEMDALLEVAERHGLFLIEDAAQAHGAQYKSRPCGSFGIAGCFSFYPSKNIGAYGDAGMIVTSDRQLAERLRSLRNYGQIERDTHQEKGMNARLDSLQAAILTVKLRHLPRWNARRVELATTYKHALAGVGDLRFQICASYATHVYHLFILETERRDQLQNYLTHANIQTRIHYPVSIHLQPAYADAGYGPGAFPQAERLNRRMLSLPVYHSLQAEQIEYIISKIKQFYLQ